MYLTLKKLLLTTISFSLPFLTLAQYEIPNGWESSGSALLSYQIGLENKTSQEGVHSAFIESLDKEINGFATIMQACYAENFIGKKVKMTGYIKSENVDIYAGLWLRIDGEDEGEPLGFDNMSDRPIKGTQDWTKYEIIMVVPEKSTKLAYGALLFGTGKIWFDNVSFEEVSLDSDVGSGIYITKGPTNTNFEN